MALSGELGKAGHDVETDGLVGAPRALREAFPDVPRRFCRCFRLFCSFAFPGFWAFLGLFLWGLRF